MSTISPNPSTYPSQPPHWYRDRCALWEFANSTERNNNQPWNHGFEHGHREADLDDRRQWLAQIWPWSPNGHSVLHIACELRDVQCLELILQHEGSDKLLAPSNVDPWGEHPLHRALANSCFCKKCNSQAAQCVQLLLDRADTIIGCTEVIVNLKNGAGQTPLYFAALNRLTECGKLLVASGAHITVVDKGESMQLQGGRRQNTPDAAQEEFESLLIANIPQVFETLLDKSIRMSATNHSELELDFGFLLYKRNPVATWRGGGGVSPTRSSRRVEFRFLNKLMQVQGPMRQAISTHPVTQALISKKWKLARTDSRIIRYGYVLVGVIFCAYLYGFYRYACPWAEDDVSPAYTDASTTIKTREIDCWLDVPIFIQIFGYFSLIIPAFFIFAAVRLVLWLREVKFNFRICGAGEDGRRLPVVAFFFNKVLFNSNIYWTIYALVATTTIVPLFLYFEKVPGLFYSTAALAALMTCTMYVVLMLNVPSQAVYVHILQLILKSVFLVLLIFIFFIMGFIIAFHIVFPVDDHPLGHPYYSFMRVLLLMIGDTDYDAVFGDMETESLFFVPAQLLFAGFVILITIVFMNFLVGMSVSDVRELKEEAEMTQLSSQIEYIYYYETVLANARFSWKKLRNAINVGQVTAHGRLEFFGIEGNFRPILSFPVNGRTADESILKEGHRKICAVGALNLNSLSSSLLIAIR